MRLSRAILTANNYRVFDHLPDDSALVFGKNIP